MEKKVGRNDPCPCGSGKKYKQCCLKLGPKPKFKAVLLSGKKEAPKQMPDLLERTFGQAIEQLKTQEKPEPISSHKIKEENTK
ncbi:Conserved hypothetical protein [Criblamydia sequanensis CRIB-18]|uniref:Uncharacterized protein n=1 Tax=Candidatus Criblamydia sequanensis CRIB-18 TaxID=1437425 RepID=A0A090CYZ8_9BACT|nr:Conserved hypothetical protein [Criblamydia sequanensis CRIB-18]